MRVPNAVLTLATKMYTKIGMMQRRLPWSLCKNDTQNHKYLHIFYLISEFDDDFYSKKVLNK